MEKSLLKNLQLMVKRVVLAITMSLLVRDKVVQDLPLDELSKAGCKRESSCSQELVKALKTMLKFRRKD
jgi:hypothetical protein